MSERKDITDIENNSAEGEIQSLNKIFGSRS